MSRPAYITVWCAVGNLEITKTREIKEQVGTREVEKQTLFRGLQTVEKPIFEKREEEVGTGKYEFGTPDVAGLADEVAASCNAIHEDGYDVVSIMPMQFGDWNHQHKVKERTSMTRDGIGYGGYGFGYGMGTTRGVIITGKLRSADAP